MQDAYRLPAAVTGATPAVQVSDPPLPCDDGRRSAWAGKILTIFRAVWLMTAAVAMCAGNVHAQSALPDPAVTPGAINPDVTQATIVSTICVRGWTRTVRPPPRYTSSLKRRQLRVLDWPDQQMRNYEEDHLIPLGLGGAPADRRNLWPEPREPVEGWTAEQKDKLEDMLHGMVCAGTVSLAEAQRAIAGDWTAAYSKLHVSGP